MVIATSLFIPDANALLLGNTVTHTRHRLHARTTPLLPQQCSGTPAAFIVPPRHN
jgi:hypothetical protein